MFLPVYFMNINLTLKLNSADYNVYSDLRVSLNSSVRAYGAYLQMALLLMRHNSISIKNSTSCTHQHHLQRLLTPLFQFYLSLLFKKYWIRCKKRTGYFTRLFDTISNLSGTYTRIEFLPYINDPLEIQFTY